MAKLVILSSGMTGRSHELKVDKTTIGRVDDNTFPLLSLRFPAITAKFCCAVRMSSSTISILPTALSSTVTRLRGGGFETRSDLAARSDRIASGGGRCALLRAGCQRCRCCSAKKRSDNTVVLSRGVSLTDLEQGAKGFDTSGKDSPRRTTKPTRFSSSSPFRSA